RHGRRRDEKSGFGCWTTGMSFKSTKKQGIRLDEHTTFLAMEVLSTTNSAQTCINNLSHSIKQAAGINKTKTIEVVANLQQMPQSLQWHCPFSTCRRIINIRSISFRNLIT
ncbi:unnamed protein product, partial [Musa textilis]